VADDDPSKLGLYDLKTRSDEQVVRLWLADRDMVAVDRVLMNELVKLSGSEAGAVYDARADRFIKLKQVA
jgi:hypothetical protein